MKIGAMADGGYSKLLSALTDPMQKFGEWLDKNSPKINDAIGRMATSVGALTTAWVDDLSKVHWPDVAKNIDDTTKSIAGFVVELRDLVKWLIDLNEMSKGWWITKFLNRTAGGTEVKPLPSGPGFGAAHGPGVGGGLWQWLKDNWGLKQNGAPVSESNPLAVNVVKVPDGTGPGGGGGGFFSNLWNGIKGAFGGGGNKGIGGWWTPERMSHAVDRLMKEAGLSREGAAGLVARWSAVEAPGGPTSRNPNGAFGIAQWLGDRLPGINGNTDFDAQLSYAIKELNGKEFIASNALRAAKTPGEGARGASMYERAEGYSPYTGTDAYTGSTPVESVIKALDASKKALVSREPINWDKGHAWAAINANLPIGPSSVDNSSRHVSSNVTNNITVNSPDPQSAASMVGVHLDRTANDISRNLQGAFQ